MLSKQLRRKCMGNTPANKVWRVLKNMKTDNKDSAGISWINLDQWREYYQKLLTENRDQYIREIPKMARIVDFITSPIFTHKVIRAVSEQI